MKKIILNIVASMLVLFAPMAIPISAYAACNNNGTDNKSQVLQGVGSVGNDCTGSGVNGLVHQIVLLLSWIAGVIAVIMIIIAGIKYTTSGGDSSKVASAKTTLVYALVGIIVAVLAQVMVHFVLNTTKAATTPPKTTTTVPAGGQTTSTPTGQTQTNGNQ